MQVSREREPVPRLFDDLERTEVQPARYQEASFTFYNRIATAGWGRVREELERWFELYCEDTDREKINDLRARLRSTDARQHHAAWWELYVHRLLRALFPQGQITCEPNLAHIATRPDFAISLESNDRLDLFVEATTAFSGIVDADNRNAGLTASVLDAINEIDCSEFWINLDIRTFGIQQPKKREIQNPMRAWLATLDYEAERARREAQERPQAQSIHFRDWELDVTPIPKGTPTPQQRLIGMGPGGGGFINDSEYIKAAVTGKAHRYGELAAPFVIAVAPTTLNLRRHDIVRALIGTTTRRFDPAHAEGGEITLVRDGAFFIGAENVAGVLIGAAVHPWTAATTSPVLWINPNHTTLPSDWVELLPSVEIAEDGEPQLHEPRVAISELLGLEADWPGDVWVGTRGSE